MVCGLLYLAVLTPPDLSEPVYVLYRILHNPTTYHLQMAHRVMSYISGTTSFGLHHANGYDLRMESLCVTVDANWGDDLEIRRSTYSYIIAVNETPVY